MHNPENERIKRAYFTYLKEARRVGEHSIDTAAVALARFDEYTKYRDFKRFHIQQAIGFKTQLSELVSPRTGQRLSRATVFSTLSTLRAFFQWLSTQPGYRSRLTSADVRYLATLPQDAKARADEYIRQAPAEVITPLRRRLQRVAQLSELIVRFDPRLDPATNPPTSWKLDQSATMRVIETNRPVIIEDAQVCDEFLAYKEDSLLRGYRTVVILPLGNTDQLGREMTIAVHSREKISVSESELAFLSTVTQLASIAVEKAKRVRFEQDLAQRLRQTIEISSQLMERVLAEGSMETVVEVLAAVVPFPLIIVDLAAGTSSVRRSPLPKLIGERKWKRLVGEELAPAIADLVRTSAMGGGKTRGVLAVPHDAGAVTLHPVVEPLQVHKYSRFQRTALR
jgi:GAF domain-containing protein